MRLPRVKLTATTVTAFALTIGVAALTPAAAPARTASPASPATQDWQTLLGGTEPHEHLRVQPVASTGSCGVERWSVKTGTDADAGSVNTSATTSTTIAALDAVPAPSSLPSNNRVAPTETTQYGLDATLVEDKLETDSDYHLVLQDGAGNTMIAEIPDPACVGAGSPFASSISQARSSYDAKYAVGTSFATRMVPVHITGIGFFDYQHGQTGVAPNAIELHPVTSICFGSSCGGGGGGQLLSNPGFETGTAAPWAASSGVVSNSSSEPARSGSWDAWLDGYGSTHTDTLSQTVTVPSTVTAASLSFWLHIDTAETTTATAYDTLKVQLVNSSGTVLKTLATFSNLNHNTGYGTHTYDVSAYKGQTVTLKFTGAEDSTLQTSFVLDDTSLTTS